MSVAPNWIQNTVGSVANTFASSAGLDANNAQTMLNFFEQNRDYNNAWSASQARIQRQWQEQQNAKAMAFNQSEAQKNRDWQEMMSNTAHQREMADLKAAGLNPILSAMNGNGAAVTSGSTASGVSSSGAAGQTDTSMNQMLVTLLGSFLDAQTKLQQSNINAINNLAVASKQGEINESLTKLKHNNEVFLRQNYPDGVVAGISALIDALGLGEVDNPNFFGKVGKGISSGLDKLYDAGYKFGKDLVDGQKEGDEYNLPDLLADAWKELKSYFVKK